MTNKSIQIEMFRECHGRHTHNYQQIMIPIEKDMKVFVDKEEYTVTSRELILIPRHMEHETNFHGRILTLNLMDEEELKEKILLKIPFVVSMKEQILQLVDLIQSELRQDPNSNSVYFLYLFLYNKLMQCYAPPSIRYIVENYNLQITIEQLAEMESYNVTYYNDWFKQQTGVSPGMYLRRTRINKAKELLEKTEFSMTEVAVMVGYSNNSTFTRAFKSITGEVPKQYRKRFEDRSITRTTVGA